MEINTIDDLNAVNEYQKVQQIERIEKKIHRLSFVPAMSVAGLMIWAFLSMWLGAGWSSIHIVLIGVAIGSVGHANVQRTDLLEQLFKLKYGHLTLNQKIQV